MLTMKVLISTETLRVRVMMTWTVSVSSWTGHVTDSLAPEALTLMTAALPRMTPASLKKLQSQRRGEVGVVEDPPAQFLVNTASCLTPAVVRATTIKYSG